MTLLEIYQTQHLQYLLDRFSINLIWNEALVPVERSQYLVWFYIACIKTFEQRTTLPKIVLPMQFFHTTCTIPYYQRIATDVPS
mgnify:CR=1 FL=1